MSIYSGFLTRQQELEYNNLVVQLIMTLTKRIVKLYSQAVCDEEKFKFLIGKICKKMMGLEEGKFMEPKYSICLTEMTQTLKINVPHNSKEKNVGGISHSLALKKNRGEVQKSSVGSSRKRCLFHPEIQKIQENYAIVDPSNQCNIPPLLNMERRNHLGSNSQQMPVLKNLHRCINDNPVEKIYLQRINIQTLSSPQINEFLPKKNDIQPGVLNWNPSSNRKIKSFSKQKQY